MSYRFFRSPRTTAERRLSLAAEEVRVRARRNWRNLPSAYDDINRTIQRTWKAFREYQWRGR